VRNEVIDMSAKAVFLDRLLAGYGPESAEARARLHDAIEENVRRMWPREAKRAANLTPPAEAGNAVYMSIQSLTPKDETQRSLKTEAIDVAVDLGKIRTLLVAQSIPSISKIMLAVLISWLVIIFFSFSMLAPTTAPAITALVISALSVCGAIFLILELGRPFGGLIGLSSEPMRNALAQLLK
jgi:membrane-bound ClpP family serine protease